MVHATLGIPAPTREGQEGRPGGVRLPRGRGRPAAGDRDQAWGTAASTRRPELVSGSRHHAAIARLCSADLRVVWWQVARVRLPSSLGFVWSQLGLFGFSPHRRAPRSSAMALDGRGHRPAICWPFWRSFRMLMGVGRIATVPGHPTTNRISVQRDVCRAAGGKRRVNHCWLISFRVVHGTLGIRVHGEPGQPAQRGGSAVRHRGGVSRRSVGAGRRTGPRWCKALRAPLRHGEARHTGRACTRP
jgi:hypothetical protein